MTSSSESWHHLPKITKTCQTGYTNHDIIHLKIAHDLIFMRYHSSLFMRSRQKVMTSATLIYSPHLNEIPPQKGDNSVRPILLTIASLFPFVNSRTCSCVLRSESSFSVVKMTNSFVKICFFFLAHVPSEVPLCVGNLVIAAKPMILPINSR